MLMVILLLTVEYIVSGTVSGNNITINNNSTITGGSLDLGGNITMNNGFLDINGSFSANNVRLNNSSLFTVDGDFQSNNLTVNSGGVDLVIARDYVSTGNTTVWNNGDVFVFGDTNGCSGNGCHQIQDLTEWLDETPPPGEGYVEYDPGSGSNQTLAASLSTICSGETIVLTATLSNPVACGDIDTVLVNINDNGWSSITNGFSSHPCQMTTLALNTPGTYLYKYHYKKNKNNKGYSNTVTFTVNSSASAGTVTAGTSPQCIAETTTYTVSGEALGGGTGAWTSDDTGVATVNASTGIVTAVGSGTCNIIYTVTGGCGGDVSDSQPYTVTPNVGIPSAITISSGTEPSCQLTNGTTTTTYATTATNSTGFNWSLSNALAGSINAITGIMTWADGFSGSVDIQVTANGCNGPSALISRTVTVYSISATISSGTSDWECPELIPAQGFIPDNDAPYNAGTTKLIFRVTRGSSISAWSFTYAVTGGTVDISYFPYNPASGPVNVNAGDNFINMIFFINNTPGSAQSIVFEITSVNDTEHGCSTNYAIGSNTETINISAMPAVGPYSP